MDQGSVFKSNRGQLIRLPQSVALPKDVTRVDVVAIGRTRIISPAGEEWGSWFEGECVSPDFTASPEQSHDQEPEGF
ncbi:Antitoxin VapB [compost metagenome]|jgi:antitoxin VapB